MARGGGGDGGNDQVALTAQAIALSACGLFSGAALYISLVEHPASLEAGVASAYRFFPCMYRRASKLQGALALAASHAAMVAGARAARASEKGLWSAAALMVGAVWPWTVFAMLPLNKTVLTQTEQHEGTQAAQLRKWARLHAVRTALSCSAMAVMVGTVLARRRG